MLQIVFKICIKTDRECLYLSIILSLSFYLFANTILSSEDRFIPIQYSLLCVIDLKNNKMKLMIR